MFMTLHLSSVVMIVCISLFIMITTVTTSVVILNYDSFLYSYPVWDSGFSGVG